MNDLLYNLLTSGYFWCLALGFLAGTVVGSKVRGFFHHRDISLAQWHEDEADRRRGYPRVRPIDHTDFRG